MCKPFACQKQRMISASLFLVKEKTQILRSILTRTHSVAKIIYALFCQRNCGQLLLAIVGIRCIYIFKAPFFFFFFGGGGNVLLSGRVVKVFKPVFMDTTDLNKKGEQANIQTFPYICLISRFWLYMISTFFICTCICLCLTIYILCVHVCLSILLSLTISFSGQSASYSWAFTEVILVMRS